MSVGRLLVYARSRGLGCDPVAGKHKNKPVLVEYTFLPSSLFPSGGRDSENWVVCKTTLIAEALSRRRASDK